MSSLNLEDLLYEEESSYLDFKQEQYKFSGKGNEIKSELLKDILAFANAWRRQEAIILIGVEEIKGGRCIVHGVDDHLEDANLQQFIQSKVNKPISFTYEARTLDSMSVGVIRIPVQERPFFATKIYGKVQQNAVYLRRGSSTAMAEPDEVFKMGASWNEETVEYPVLKISLGDKNQDTTHDQPYKITSTVLRLPARHKIPLEQSKSNVFSGEIGPVNRNYYRDFGDYLREHALLEPLWFRAVNSSSIVARDVHIEIAWESPAEFLIRNEYPSEPIRRGPDITGMHTPWHEPESMEVAKKGGFWRQTIRLGNVKPKARVWSPVFYVGCSESGLAEASASIYAENLPIPLSEHLSIEFEPRDVQIDVEKLIQVADK